MSIILLSFYTEGFPHDNGINLTDEKNRFISLTKNFYDKIILYNPRKLIDEKKNWEKILYDKDFFNKHIKPSKEYKINLNWAATNGFLWKPALIKLVLNKSFILENDILIYHDFNIKKYPDHLERILQLPNHVRKKLINSSVITEIGLSALSHGVKKEVLDKYLQISGDNHLIFSGRFIAFKKNQQSKDFCNEWLKLLSIEENRSQITKYPYKKNFIWHTQDQAILSVLIYLWCKNKRRKYISSIRYKNSKASLAQNLKYYLYFIKFFTYFYFTKNPINVIKEYTKISPKL